MTLRSHQKLPVPTKCRLSPLPCFFFFFLGAHQGWQSPLGLTVAVPVGPAAGLLEQSLGTEHPQRCCTVQPCTLDTPAPGASPGSAAPTGHPLRIPGLPQAWWGRMGGSPGAQGYVSCSGVSLSTFTVFACFTSSVQRGYRGSKKLHSSEERPTYTPTVARASSASLCENKAAQRFVRERYINPHPIAGDGRAAEAQPGASSRCSNFRPEKQSLLIYFPLTFLAALLRFGMADAELLSSPGLRARGGAGADQAGLQVLGDTAAPLTQGGFQMHGAEAESWAGMRNPVAKRARKY